MLNFERASGRQGRGASATSTAPSSAALAVCGGAPLAGHMLSGSRSPKELGTAIQQVSLGAAVFFSLPPTRAIHKRKHWLTMNNKEL